MVSLCSHCCDIAGREPTVALFLAFNNRSGVIWFFPFLVSAQTGKREISHYLIISVWRGGGKKKKSYCGMVLRDQLHKRKGSNRCLFKHLTSILKQTKV